MTAPYPEHSVTFTLTPGECSPQAVMPVTLLAARLIEVAGEHADILGVGYDRLVTDGLAWVLSRLSVEMVRWPKVNERYTVTTWVEEFNRRFSLRNFGITDDRGDTLGFCRSAWMAITSSARNAGDLSMFSSVRESISSRPCPIEKMPRLDPIDPDDPEVSAVDHRFLYCDCDFNRHVNTLRYIEAILNRWDMAFFDSRQVGRLDIAFMHEARCGDLVKVMLLPRSPLEFNAEIAGPELTNSRARIIFKEFNNQ